MKKAFFVFVFFCSLTRAEMLVVNHADIPIYAFGIATNPGEENSFPLPEDFVKYGYSVHFQNSYRTDVMAVSEWSCVTFNPDYTYTITQVGYPPKGDVIPPETTPAPPSSASDVWLCFTAGLIFSTFLLKPLHE